MSLFRKVIWLLALVICVPTASFSQNLIYDIEFDTYFDNREYAQTDDFGYRSGTDFAVSLAPTLGLQFDEDNTLYFGLQSFAPFEEVDNRLFDTIETILYYAYNGTQWSAAAGIFPRSRMAIGSYSTAFFADDYLFYDRLVSGVMGQYRVDDSFVEMVCDWESQPSETSRERFRLLSAGRRYWSRLYAGYNLSVTHFAGQQLEGFNNVVDNLLLNPRVGARWSGVYDVDLSIGYLQSMQRDRSYGNEWLAPYMGELSLSVSRWGVTFTEQAYFGDDLSPLYDGHILADGTVVEYGAKLYTGDPFFRTTSGFYNRAAVGYSRTFFDGQLALRAQFVTHADGSGLGTEQILDVAVKIGGTLYKSKK
ncbi:MAG: hypothetical protein SNJ09_07265 [Rikenellaceae bacterium]